METRLLTARVPLPLAEKVDQLAERLERSPGWIVEQALAAWVDQQEERRRLTLQALADVDARRVVDHPAVRARTAAGTTTTRSLRDARNDRDIRVGLLVHPITPTCANPGPNPN
jgi:predicted transcriptional regulator